MPRILKPFAGVAAVSLAIVAGLLAPTVASAAGGNEAKVVKAPKAAPAPVNAELAVCPGQSFLQAFTELGDSNYYTLVEGSESASTGQGWELLNGASVVEGTRPDGTTGGVFDLPAGAVAISPPTCVTLLYPTARVWTTNVEAGSSVQVGVVYEQAKPAKVATLNPAPGNGWELSAPINIQPQLGGSLESAREVRFAYVNTGKKGDSHIAGLYVDPRLSH